MFYNWGPRPVRLSPRLGIRDFQTFLASWLLSVVTRGIHVGDPYLQSYVERFFIYFTHVSNYL